jgi:putative oxidoreductase
MDFAELQRAWTPRLLGVLRIVAALLFLEHGTQKLFGFPASANAGGSLSTMLLAAALIEVVGGALLVIGFKTQIAAFICSGQMAAAYFIAHFPRSFFPIQNNGDAAILYCFIFLYIAAAGAGAWSLDERKPAATPADPV